MIGSTIQELRKQKGLSLTELADRANISKSYLSNIERNLNQNPSLQVMQKIAGVLDIELKTLLNLESSQNYLEHEWVEFIKDLKESGADKEQIADYKLLIEFINWKNGNESTK